MANDLRGYTITSTSQLIVEECCRCGITFAMPRDFQRHCIDDHSLWFYCPNGHSQHYTGPTPEQRAKAEATRLQASLDRERANSAHLDRRLSAAKGQQTKLRKRIAAGVCPCCHRHFANVERHMTNQHPTYPTKDGSP